MISDIYLERALEELEELRKENKALKEELARLWAFYDSVKQISDKMREIIDDE